MNKAIFEDTFEVDGTVDKSKWNFDIGGHGWGNNELQFYTDSLKNAYIKNHVLHITAKKEKYDSNEYTSAKMTTYLRKSFKYGSFRIKCKIPSDQGLWPAIWLLPVSFKEGNSWPKCGEIDILEHVSSEPGNLYFSLHSNKYNFKNGMQITKMIKNMNIFDRFVELRMDWTKEGFIYYIDGEEVVKFDKPLDANIDNWPFDQEQYLIINLAVGGSWPGNPKDDFNEASFQVEYVKVYCI